jgi:hypothetical protein
VEIRQGTANIEQVVKDVMSLTKLNFNGAEYCDRLPVTLRFADLVGEILTAGADHAPRSAAFQILHLRRMHHGRQSEDTVALFAHADTR